MRLAALAEVLAPFEHASPADLHQILRGPAFQILLEARPGRGRTSPADYATKELARARLLLACRDCGLTGAELQAVARHLGGSTVTGAEGAPPSAKVEGGSHYLAALDSMIRGARAGETWFLRVRIAVNAEGTRRVYPWARWEGWAESWRAISLRDLTHVEQTRGLLEIPASALIEPLLEHIEAT